MMNFTELIQKTQALPLEQVRKNVTGYFEFVIPVEHEKGLYPILEDFFGPPFKPKNTSPDAQAKKISYDYGGIEKHQVLYYTEKNGLPSCAMIWPWNDGRFATVKMAQGEIKKISK